MYIYIGLLALAAIPLFFQRIRLNTYNKLIWYFLVPLIVCFGYMTGTDWVNYEKEWMLINVRRYNPFVDGYEEPGYWLLCYLFKKIGVGFWEMNIGLKLLGYFVFLKVYKYYCRYSTWGLLYAFVFWMLYSIMNYPARNFCAWIFFIYAIRYIEERNIKKYALFCLCAIFFHISILMVVPLYFLRLHLSKKGFYISLIFIAVFVILFGIFRWQIWGFSQNLTYLGIADRTESFADGTHRYSGEISRTTFSFGFIARTLIYILAIINMEKIYSRFKHGEFILNMSLFVVIFDGIVTIVPIFARALYAIVIIYCVLFSYVLSVLDYNRIIKNAVAFVFLLLFTYGTVTNYIYVPYSNYLEYVLAKEKPSYAYRIGYNWRHTPYKSN